MVRKAKFGGRGSELGLRSLCAQPHVSPLHFVRVRILIVDRTGYILVLLRFKTQPVQFRQESYGAYRPRPAAQLLSVHPG